MSVFMLDPMIHARFPFVLYCLMGRLLALVTSFMRRKEKKNRVDSSLNIVSVFSCARIFSLVTSLLGYSCKKCRINTLYDC